jgi:hypothetical protein
MTAPPPTTAALAGHPPRRDLDRLAAQELAAPERQPIETHVATCAECRAYLESRRREQAELVERLPPEVFAASVLSRPARGAESGPGWRLALAASSAVAVLALLALWFWRPPPEPARWRGDAAVVRVVLEREGQRSLLGDIRPRPGDRLRFEIALPPSRRAWTALVAIENGRALPVLPPSREDPPFEIRGSGWLPGSAAVVAGPPARLMLVLRPAPFSLASLLAEVEQAEHAGRAPEGLAHELLLDGEAP